MEKGWWNTRFIAPAVGRPISLGVDGVQYTIQPGEACLTIWWVLDICEKGLDGGSPPQIVYLTEEREVPLAMLMIYPTPGDIPTAVSSARAKRDAIVAANRITCKERDLYNAKIAAAEVAAREAIAAFKANPTAETQQAARDAVYNNAVVSGPSSGAAFATNADYDAAVYYERANAIANFSNKVIDQLKSGDTFAPEY